MFVFVHLEIDDMARTNRRHVLADGEIQVVCWINSCVRRAYFSAEKIRPQPMRDLAVKKAKA